MMIDHILHGQMNTFVLTHMGMLIIPTGPSPDIEESNRNVSCVYSSGEVNKYSPPWLFGEYDSYGALRI